MLYKVPISRINVTYNFNSKNFNRICTFYHRNGHTIDLCYQKHEHPKLKKGKPFVNMANNDRNGATQPSDETIVTSHPSNNVPISQALYDELVNLLQLQQENLTNSI